MTKNQSSQARFVHAALVATALAFALTALPGTALADGLPDNQQQPTPVEEQIVPVAEETIDRIKLVDGDQDVDSDGARALPGTEDQATPVENDSAIEDLDSQAENEINDVQASVIDDSETSDSVSNQVDDHGPVDDTGTVSEAAI